MQPEPRIENRDTHLIRELLALRQLKSRHEWKLIIARCDSMQPEPRIGTPEDQRIVGKFLMDSRTQHKSSSLALPTSSVSCALAQVSLPARTLQSLQSFAFLPDTNPAIKLHSPVVPTATASVAAIRLLYCWSCKNVESTWSCNEGFLLTHILVNKK